MAGKKLIKSGFTLVELMVVVSIIGILATIAIPKFADLIRKSKEGATKGNLGSIRSALSIYYGDMEGQYPAQLIAMIVNSKYLSTLPLAEPAYYHADSTIEMDGNSDISKCPATQTIPNDAGGWAYVSCTTDPKLGLLLVNCTHTDSKGTVWSAY